MAHTPSEDEIRQLMRSRKIADPSAAQGPRVTSDVLATGTNIKCVCGNETFAKILIFRKLSKIAAPQLGDDAIVPIELPACNACGAIPGELFPEFLRTKDAATEIQSSIVLSE
jgi:hypothetical protein